MCIDVYIECMGCEILFEVDGGVKVDNIVEIVVVGVDMFVVGLVIFGKFDYCKVIDEMCVVFVIVEWS